MAGIVVFLMIRKSRGPETAAVDAGFDTSLVGAELDAGTSTGAGTPDAAVEPDEIDAALPRSIDAAEVAPTIDAAAVAIDASVPIDAAAPQPDAGTKPPPDAGADNPAMQAKVLMQQAADANQEGDFEKALALANSSLKLRRTARAYLVRAQALQRLGRIDDALDSVDSAEELAPDYASVFEMRGSILWAAGRIDAAKRVYERFLELEPDSARAAQVRRKIQGN
jgi:tetratricopeptide (TPR) repeat protein